ncbi:hypothetical protein H6P81_013646 [Aristolochia fimbriata]|uniref:Helitron helicase-like domain-containing protein n=1 Tax=Aristolochia fimbriata TaxID=158543 RepID=A0AAV7EF95_ARIFI|nr:hypothetical protein H6P81_013646 [Aristolochia fimbriata]
MLDRCNQLTKVFRIARDYFQENETISLKLKLVGIRDSVDKRYEVSISSEIAALLVGDGYEDKDGRDIVIDKIGSGLQRIKETHPSFMAMHYPLFFPYGEEGYTLNIDYENRFGQKPAKRNNVSMREYYAYRLQQRLQDGQTLLRGGKFHQYVVDAYACIEEYRLMRIRNNQKKIRVELYKGI